MERIVVTFIRQSTFVNISFCKADCFVCDTYCYLILGWNIKYFLSNFLLGKFKFL